MFAQLILTLVMAFAQVTDSAAVRPSEADFARGVGLQQRGDLDGARAARAANEAALKNVPRRFDAPPNLGVVRARLGNYGQAIRFYQQALALHPDEHAVRLNLGLAYFKSEALGPAARELPKVAAAQPGNRQARLLRGLSLYQPNKLPEAIAELETVYRAAPDDPSAAYPLGTAYISSNRTEDAAALIDKVFRGRDSAEARLIMGALHLSVKELPKAVEELESAARLNPRLPTLRSHLGTAYRFSGNREQASREFAAELEANPRDFNANAPGLGLPRRRAARRGHPAAPARARTQAQRRGRALPTGAARAGEERDGRSGRAP